MSSMKLRFVLAAVLLFGPLPRASAWNEVGHMTVAKLAYEQLDHKQKQAIDHVLREHPHYKMYLTANAPDGPDGPGAKEWAFLRAATWPDWVRPLEKDDRVDDTGMKVTRFHRPDDHFIDLPFVPPADKDKFDPTKLQPDEENALVALTFHTATLKSKLASKADKAVALCWVLHLIGDLHQPLHCAKQFSTIFPTTTGPDRGDRGGNFFGCRIDGEPVRLHTYWDDILGLVPGVTHDTPARQKKVYARIKSNYGDLRDPAFARDKLPELKKATTFAQWADESHAAAVAVAYWDGDNGKLLEAVLVPSGKDVPADAPKAGAGYAATAKKTAQRRVALAGFRLADHLTVLFPVP